MHKTFFRTLLVAALVLSASLGTRAMADLTADDCDNCQSGDNSTDATQNGTSQSGDAVAGQVVGVVSAGDASVDATNRSDNVDIETGNTRSDNRATTFTGLLHADDADTDIGAADVTVNDGANVQEGDNSTDLSQTANSSSGDGVGGQVIGVVTSAGGSADIVAANRSTDVTIDTGDSRARNDSASFVGLLFADDSDFEIGVNPADLTVDDADNAQEGDNSLDGKQVANASSGDGVGGSVLGVVSAGDASIDATNRSDNVDIETGDTRANNAATAFVGLLDADDSDVDIGAADVTANDAGNLQEGDNSGDFSQTANANSGDSVAGQVAGVVTSAGGSADLVLASTTVDSDASSGSGSFSNDERLFVGFILADDSDVALQGPINTDGG
jgi:hypothetical protein